MAGLTAVALVKGEPVVAAPPTTAIGALSYYVSHANPAHYEPSNITFGIMPALGAHGNGVRTKIGRKARNELISHRALTALQQWMNERDTQTVPSVSPA